VEKDRFNSNIKEEWLCISWGSRNYREECRGGACETYAKKKKFFRGEQKTTPGGGEKRIFRKNLLPRENQPLLEETGREFLCWKKRSRKVEHSLASTEKSTGREGGGVSPHGFHKFDVEKHPFAWGGTSERTLSHRRKFYF